MIFNECLKNQFLNIQGMEMNIEQVEVLQAINRAELELQISTAKKYPRDIEKVLKLIKTYATMDTEAIEDYFYIMRRDGKLIEGLSVRMAEVLASSWGNIRVQTHIVGNDGKKITAQGSCYDLEHNLSVSVDVERSITNLKGKTYSEDMQVLTGNAASSIAFRNAILKIIPKAITKKVINEIKQIAIGQDVNIDVAREEILKYYDSIGVTQKQLFDYLSIGDIGDMNVNIVFELKALKNAIKEGTTTVKETFIPPMKTVEEKKEAIKKKDKKPKPEMP